MSGKNLAVWICNIVIAILSILSIVCYFFGPFWRVSATINVTPDMFRDLLKDSEGNIGGGEDSPLKDLKIEDIIGEDGLSVSAGFEIGTDDIFASVGGSSEEVFDNIVTKNVNSIIEELRPVLTDIAKNTVKTVAKTTVKDQVHKNVKSQIAASNDEEAQQKMDALGITDDYIDEKVSGILDTVFEGKSTVEEVTNTIMDTIDDVYKDIQSKASELSATDPSFNDIKDMQFTDEDKESLRADVQEMLDELATKDGKIDPDVLIDELLSKALNGDNGSGGSSSTGSSVAKLAAAADGTDGADGAPTEGAEGSTGEGESAEDLATQLKNLLMEQIGSISGYFQYVLYVMGGLMLLSMLAWLYILIKLIVKLAKRSPNPTVKLKCPIWLGWLPYMILVALPGIALLILPLLKSTLPLPEIFFNVRLTVSSISIIAMISAVICFGISIFYMVLRRKDKKAAKAAKNEAQE